MSFNTQPFGQRFATMGDPAESAFTERNPTAHRLGLCRPEFNMSAMPAAMRYAPDYMIADGFVECMGIASRGSGTLKLKVEKADSLQLWALLGPTFLWVWDSSKRRWWEAPIQQWIDACHRFGTIERFPDNKKPYWELHHMYFPGGARCSTTT